MMNCIKRFGIKLVLCNLHLTRFDLTKSSVDFFSMLFCTNCGVIITEYLNVNHVHTNESVN